MLTISYSWTKFQFWKVKRTKRDICQVKISPEPCNKWRYFNAGNLFSKVVFLRNIRSLLWISYTFYTHFCMRIIFMQYIFMLVCLYIQPLCILFFSSKNFLVCQFLCCIIILFYLRNNTNQNSKVGHIRIHSWNREGGHIKQCWTPLNV